MNKALDFDAGEYLRGVGNTPDPEIDLATTALALSLKDHPGLSADKYFNHLKKLAAEVAERHKALLDGGAEDDTETQLAALKHILADQHSYEGDEDTYDDLQNADMVRVIDRRRGMPIALAILYLHAGQAQGWDLEGLNFPGRFLCRIEKEGRRIIFDPFDRCKVLQAPDLRKILKELTNANAELSVSYYESAPRRDILIRLQNNIKLRQIEGEDYEGAVQTIESMQVIDPNEYRLLLDAGVLYARTGKVNAAIKALETYIDKAPNPKDRHEAAILLQQIRDTLT